jgi:hypothetical protein
MTIKIRVGRDKEQRDFTVHDCIIERALFFKNALRKGWKEADDRIVERT